MDGLLKTCVGWYRRWGTVLGRAGRGEEFITRRLSSRREGPSKSSLTSRAAGSVVNQLKGHMGAAAAWASAMGREAFWVLSGLDY